MTSDEAEIRRIIADWAKAVREHDLAGVREAHDDGILLFDVPPPFSSRGIAAYMESWTGFFDWSTKPVAFDFDDVEVTAGQDVAFVTAIGHCRGVERSGQTIELDFRLTMGLRKRDGRWLITHEHHSIPATE